MLEGWKDQEEILDHQSLLYMLKIVGYKVISRYHDDPLADHFGIEKTMELVARKYFLPSLKKDIEAYVKGYNVYLTSKTISYKPYGDL